MSVFQQQQSRASASTNIFAALRDGFADAEIAKAADPNAPKSSSTKQPAEAPTQAVTTLSTNEIQTSKAALRARFPPDEDPLLRQFSRFVMRDGKLHTAHTHMHDMLDQIRHLTAQEPLPLVRRAVGLAAPMFRNVYQRITATKRVTLPLPLDEKHRVRQALEWIVNASQKRKSEKVFGRRLAHEILAVVDGNSDVIRKRDEVHRQATIARYCTLT